MRCEYFDTGLCHSCRRMGEPYPEQLRDKAGVARQALAAFTRLRWEEPVASPPDGYRNKAKMVVGGTVAAPTLGILDADGHGVDLRRCGICSPGHRAAFRPLAEFIGRARLVPYDVPGRTGELKHLLVTESPDGELMVRFVLRSTESVPRIRKHLPWLRERLPSLLVASVNLLPEHRAALEGAEEIALTEAESLPMRLGAITLHLRPQSFFQTNTAIATALYRTAADWTGTLGSRSIWDLYCGVGGFALHLAAPGVAVAGVEASAEAIRSARRSALDAGLDVEFLTGDATDHAVARGGAPELVVVNPPRRGIGATLASWLDRSGAHAVLYSSCNPTSLAADLARMPGFTPVRAQVFDMFPQTDHTEVLVLAVR